MRAVVMRTRAQLRERAVGWCALALLIGLAGGVVLTAAAGARRTNTAYPRFLVSAHAADLLLSPNESGSTAFYQAMARLPGASNVAPVIGYGVAPADNVNSPILVQAATDGQLGTSIERPKILHGRLLHADAADEVLADVTAAHQFGLRAGSTLRIVVANASEELPDPKHDPVVTLHVVGIGVSRDNIVTTNALAMQPTLLAGPQFAKQFGPKFYAFDGAMVRLDPGVSKQSYITEAQQLATKYPQTGGGVFAADEATQAAAVEHAIRPQAVALALFAALFGLTFVVALGLLMSRHVHVAAADNATLASLGFGRRDLFAILVAQAALVSFVGAVVAVLVAFVASPLMPIGPARLAEPHSGFAFDALVLGVGALAIFVFTTGFAALTAWRDAQLRAYEQRTAPLRARGNPRVVPVGAAPSIAIGVQHATESGRHAAVPNRTALLGVALAIGAVAGALTFGANLAHLVQTPARYGQTWSLSADAQFSNLQPDKISAFFAREPGVVAWTYGEHGDIVVNGDAVAAVGLTSAHGPLLAPAMVNGQPAATAGEIALGGKTLATAHAAVGHTVSVDLVGVAPGSTKPVPMTVVGRSVFPFFGRGSFTPTGLGVGAQIAETKPGALNPGQPPAYNFVLVQVAPGPDHRANVARVVHDLEATDLCGLDNQCTVATTNRPDDIMNYARVRLTPIALAAVLVALAILVVASLLMTSVRRRRNEFATLRVLGFTRRQDAVAVFTQSATTVGVALLIGLPLGIALGRFTWKVFASNLSVPSDTITPAVLLYAIPVAVVVAFVCAVGPGLLAGSRPPARALRTQ
jgi:hypothetical protein